MVKILGKWRAALATGPNRIALSTALRGTIATVAPLVVLPLLGMREIAMFAVIGALNTSFVDVGGPYRTRLVVMGLNCTVSPGLLLAGMAASAHWWLAGPIMVAAALAAGLLRALGTGAIPLGLNAAIAFLIGIQVAEDSSGREFLWAAGYAGGALWTILLTLIFWQLRPYRRLEQEVATIWEAAADLVAAVRSPDGDAGVVARRRQEQRIAQRQRTLRDAVERGRDALGEVRAGTAGPGTTMAHLLVLLRAASRIGAAAVALGTVEAMPAEGDAAHPVLAAAVDELERTCRAVARLLLTGKGAVDLAPMRRRLAEVGALPAGAGLHARLLAIGQAVRHVDNAEEAARLLFGPGQHRLSYLLRLPPGRGAGLSAAVAAIRTHLTPRSSIFRHALRVAVVAGAGTAAITRWHLPHGIWLPMTSMIVLQPGYGATLDRALQRTAGTMAGAVLAGILLATLQGGVAYDAAIALLLFATFVLLRRRYGLAVTFLTPLIILLLGQGGPDPWLDLRNRLIDTLAGAALALAAGYLLWPQWERTGLPDRFARAIRADAAYLRAVLAALAGEAVPAPRLAELRRDAEIEVGNAEAAFQRMLGEPRRQRAPVSQGFTLLTYAQRLGRHTLALAGHLDAAPLPAADLAALGARLGGALEDVAAALVAGRAPGARPDFDEPLSRLSPALAAGPATGGTIAFLLGQVVSDTTSLLFAAGMR